MYVLQGSRSLVERAAWLWRHRYLFAQLVRRDVIGRYRGSSLGIFWSFVNPLLMLAVYTIAFRGLLGVRWPGTESTTEFSLMIFAGTLIHGAVAEVLARAPTLVTSQPNYVRKIIFPLEMLGAACATSAAFHALVGIVALVLATFVIEGRVPQTAVLWPVAVAPFGLFLVGTAWILSSAGVYLRDVGQMSGLLVAILMFLSPIFYPISMVPAEYRWLLELNPLTFPIEQTRGLLLLGQPLDWAPWLAYTAAAVAFAAITYVLFRATSRGFGDVL